MATVHMIYGFLGSGKTTFARRLAGEVSGVRLSTDELYLRLFAEAPTYELNPKALQRLVDVLAELWPQVVASGIDVVLDYGFWRRTLRDSVRQLAARAGAQTRLYWLKCPNDVALARCVRRNGGPNTFLISEQGFHEMKSRFEPLGSDELAEIVDTSLETCRC